MDPDLEVAQVAPDRGALVVGTDELIGRRFVPLLAGGRRTLDATGQVAPR